MFPGIFTSVVGALIIAAILSAVKSRWLYVVAPKLYLNTPISDGQIISLNIFNAGLTAEEDVAVTFRQACKFELIGTSKSTLAISGKTISIPKLSRLESVTVVLLIEGKAFDPIDIESVESKSTKGKVVESKEKATAIWQGFIFFPVFMLLLIIPFVLGTYIGSEEKTNAIAYLDAKLELFGDRKQLAGYKTTIRQTTNYEVLEKALERQKIMIETIEVVRRGDLLTITNRITNKMDEPLLIEGFLKTSAGTEGPLNFRDERFDQFGLGPNEHRVIVQRAYLPEDVATKFIENTITVKTLAGDSMYISQLMQF